MMKKTLLAAGLAAAMTVSTGLAVAGAQEVVDETPTTAVDQNQDREQVRDCDLNDGDVGQFQDGNQTRDRDCDLNNGDAVGDPDRSQVRDRDRDCELSDGDAVQLQERERAQVGADGAAGFSADRANGSSGVGRGQGVSDGTGPLHDGPEDGTGKQFGSAGR